jgi:hypothetical protein
MGFVRWTGNKIVGTGWQMTTQLAGGPAGMKWGDPGAFKRTAMFFLGTYDGKAPWDMGSHSASSITDGASTTIAVSENVMGGASLGGSNVYTNTTVLTNWATPHPNFVGYIVSNAVCRNGSTGAADCTALPTTAGDPNSLSPSLGKTDGAGWSKANLVGTYENINYAVRGGLSVEGSHPYVNSKHPGGFVVGMCDASVKFMTDTIDGTVWAKLNTPAGQTLPSIYRQMPLSSDQIPGN